MNEYIKPVMIGYKNDAYKFVVDFFKVTPTKQQEQVLRDVTRAKRIVVRSGHGTGKTAMLAWIVLWYITTHPLCKIPITAPTMHQLVDVFWAELSYWMSKSEILNKLFEKTATKLQPKNEKYKNVWFATLVSARKPENMQGFHGANLLFVVDEASGIPDPMFEVIESALTHKNARLIAVGNPTRNHGYFFRAFQDEKAQFKKYVFSAVESPLVSKEWIEKMVKMYGMDSDVFKIRVLGEFPAETGNYVIPASWVEAAMKNENKIYGEKVMGVDVARSGDDKTAIVIRNGYTIELVQTYSQLDTVEVAEEVDKIAQIYKVEKVVLESVGLSAGVLDILLHKKRKEHREYEVFEFVPNAKAKSDKQFKNAMAEAWWNLRKLLKPSEDGSSLISLPEDENILLHLTCRQYYTDPDGRIMLDTKEQIKASKGLSPDIGDAMAMAFYDNVQYARFVSRDHIPVIRRGNTEWAELQKF